MSIAAAEDSNIAIIKYLVEECHVNVNAVDNDKNTPLMIGAQLYNTNFEVIKYFVEECKCDISAVNKDGETAFMLAV